MSEADATGLPRAGRRQWPFNATLVRSSHVELWLRACRDQCWASSMMLANRLRACSRSSGCGYVISHTAYRQRAAAVGRAASRQARRDERRRLSHAATCALSAEINSWRPLASNAPVGVDGVMQSRAARVNWGHDR